MFKIFILLAILFNLAACSKLQLHSRSQLIWLNGITGKPIRHLPVYRVAQPANLTLRAEFSGDTHSVAFYDGLKFIAQDNQAPFELSHYVPTLEFKADGQTQQSRAVKNLRAVGFSATDSAGSITGELKLTAVFDFTGIQQQPRLTEQQTAVWVNSHLNEVLIKNTFMAKNGMALPYRIFIPSHYNPRVKYPLLVFLHGRGERGTDNAAKMFNAVGLFSGPQSIVAPNSQQDFPAIVLVPQCSNRSPDEEWAHWIGNSPSQPFAGLGSDGTYQQAPEASQSSAAALELIDNILGRYAIDRDRVYLTGISMGGFGTWEFTTRRPTLFAAAVPMAGYVNLQQADRLLNIPFWIFHGDQDQYNPVAGSRTISSVLKQKSHAEVIYTEYPGLKHKETFVEAWRNSNILPWMFAQRRSTGR